MRRRARLEDPRGHPARPMVRNRRLPRPDPAHAPAFYGDDVGAFLSRRARLWDAFEAAFDIREASLPGGKHAYFQAKAERLAGALQGTIKETP